jgi:UDP-N-acetylmuramoylalanine--D-glutamate ligase
MCSVNPGNVKDKMTAKEKINGRKIGIIGMARSGLSAAILAENLGGNPFVSDTKEASQLATEIERLKTAGIAFETGGHTNKLLELDYLVVSPGVPLNIEIIKEANTRGIPLFSEIEFAFWVCASPIVAVTGSNGKTTTTTLLGEIFSHAGLDTFVGGNIGKPFSEFVQKIPADGITVLEVSNFQLETISDFTPDTAIILNLTPDHLDRHGSFNDYKKAKFRITENQTKEQLLILNLDDAETIATQIETSADTKYFTATDSKQATAFVRNGSIIGRYQDEEKEIIKIDEILIPGPHNLQNALAATCTAIRYDVPPNIIKKILKTFPGVEHRMEKVGIVAGINFINDSKATNVDSVCYALRSLDKPIYLLAGGRDKNADFSLMAEFGKNKIKGIVAVGEAKEKIFESLGPHFPVQFANTLEVAVQILFEMAIPGEIILLSPGCASFDMFDNFEQRGRAFKKAVGNLKNGKGENETLAKK